MFRPAKPLTDRQLNALLAGTGVVTEAEARRLVRPKDLILFGPAALWALGYLYVALTL